MIQVTDKTHLIDLMHLGVPNIIASGILALDDGIAIVDPGPDSTMPHLAEGLSAGGYSLSDVRAILLTHIHLDHAGATGTLLSKNPDIRVYVHQRGARHMVRPERLIASATRLYGDQMDRLWGQFLPVPGDCVTALEGGEVVDLGGREIRVAYTPGHASHHVSYLDTEMGTAFTGDTGGCRMAPSDYVLAPTPPPDINVELWLQSIDLYRKWAPERLFLTHFGVADKVPEHLDALTDNLQQRRDHVADSMRRDEPDAEKAAQFARWAALDLRSGMSDRNAEEYEQAAPPQSCWYGMARWLSADR